MSKGNSNVGVVVAILLGTVIIGGGIGLYLYIRNKQKNEDEDEDEDEDKDYGSNIYGSPAISPITQNNQDTKELFDSLPTGVMAIKKGDRNKLVFIWQKYLNCRFNTGLKVDGEFGKKTEKATLENMGVKFIASRMALKDLIKTKIPKSVLGVCEETLEDKMMTTQ